MRRRDQPKWPRPSVEPARSRFASPGVWLAGAVLLAVLCYSGSIRNGWVWDDPIVLDQLRAFRSLADFVHIPDVVPKFYYRPLVFASLSLDRALGGETPKLFHLTNLLLHALNTLLVGRLLLNWPGLHSGLAAAGTLLFAVHPAHTESIAWVSGRSDLLVTTFVLLACLLQVQRRASLQLAMLPPLFFAALLTKETALALLLVLPLLDGLRGRPWRWQRDLALCGVALAYFLLRAANVGQVFGGTTRPASVPGVALDLAQALGVYLLHAFLPGLVNPYMPSIPADIAPGLAFVSAVGVLAVLLLRARTLRSSPAISLCAWFVVSLLPTTVVIVRQSASTLVADRYLYLPSVASCALTVMGLEAIARSLRGGRWLFLLLVGLLTTWSAFRSYALVPVWRNNESFWTRAVREVPLDPIANRELGLALLERGETQEARRHIDISLQQARTPEEQAIAANSLASLQRRSGDVDAAISTLRRAISLAPHPALYHNLGLAEMAAAEFAERTGKATAVASHVLNARSALAAALNFGDSEHASTYRTLWDPAKTHALLGQVLFSLGERHAARQHLQTALQLAPTGPVAGTTRQYWRQVFPGEPVP